MVKTSVNDMIKEIRSGKTVKCPECGGKLEVSGTKDLSRIYGLHCNRCNYDVHLDYSH